MKYKSLFLPLAAVAIALGSPACSDDVSKIGNSITKGEATIYIDSLEFNLHSVLVPKDRFDSRSGTFMMGNLNIPEYGSLDCSFVTRLMCVNSFPAADTVPTERVDSCKLLIGILRGNLTGDSLAPQQLSVYKLNKQLPADITNQFDPTGYYDPSAPIGKETFTISMAGRPDSIFNQSSGFNIMVGLPVEIARDIFKKYKEEPEIFAWPQTFAEYFPGLYVKNSFGKGCVANATQVLMVTYFHNFKTETKEEDGVTTTNTVVVKDSALMFSATPEVLSSNNIRYNVSKNIKDIVATGKTVITTPGGYEAKFTFPARQIIDKYNETDHHLSIVSGLTLSIPAETVENSHNLTVAPYLLLIKSSEVESFFANNKLPDSKTSFTATYDSTNGAYNFTGMRDYILDLMKKDEITEDDVDFSLIPVQLGTETVAGNYYYGTPDTEYIIKCVPYIASPTMTLLSTDKAMVVFTFSSQVIE